MSNHDLGRTAVEGGRADFHKFEVRLAERGLRRSSRVFSDADWDEYLTPVRTPLGKKSGQTDKLKPVWRFLDSRIGRPWSKVMAEIAIRFDADTLQGHHVRQHISDAVLPHLGAMLPAWSRRDFVVDQQGLLQRLEQNRRWVNIAPLVHTSQALSAQYVSSVIEWLGQRAVTRIGKKLFWAVGSEPVRLTHEHGDFGVRRVWFEPLFDSYDWDRSPVEARIMFGRGKALNAKDLAVFSAIPGWLQTQVVVPQGRVTLKRHLNQTGSGRPLYTRGVI